MTLAASLALAAALAVPPSREVLVLYSGLEGANLRGEGVPTAVELVLNHLGKVVRYHDVAQGLPDENVSRSACGVVSLVEGDQLPGAAAFARWLRARETANQPVVLLGGVGFLVDARTGVATPRDDWEPVLRGLGINYDGDFLGDPRYLDVAYSEPHMHFEVPGTVPVTAYVQATSVDPANQVLMRLRRADTGRTSDMAVLGPHGAMVLGRELLLRVNPLSFRLQWRIDPFWFFERALRLGGTPRPDPTTINGRRVFFAHVDGDGFSNVANRLGRPFASEVVRDDVLKQTFLPTTISVIAQELAGKPKLEAIARSIYALPNVEAGSHSYTHPHDWEKGIGTPMGKVVDGDEEFDSKHRVVLSPRHEIDDSLTYIKTLLPAGHQVEVMLWSGRTNPTAPFLQRCDALGLPNLNGGDARVDARFPSYANVAPLGLRVGPYLQAYAACANENLFSNLWTGPFDGQRAALETYTFTESPRRVSALNIYYHFYAAERLAGLGALHDLYRWAEKQAIAPVFASRYARMVQDFYRAEVQPRPDGGWHLKNFGSCATLRFDDEPRHLDLKSSRGVAGFTRRGQVLYVHLAPGSEADVVLARAPLPQPRLSWATAPLKSWSMRPDGLAAEFQADAPLQVELAGLPAGRTVNVTGAVKPPPAAGSDGVLRLAAGRGKVRLEVHW